MNSESAWLIERANVDGTVLHPAQWWGPGNQGWTSGHLLAIRFCRREDASRAIEELRGHLYLGTSEGAIVTEHMWGEE